MSNNKDEGSFADNLAKRITKSLTSLIASPFAFFLWIAGAVVAVGLGFAHINAALGTNRLPTFGIQAQQAIYVAGIIYLLHGKV